MNRNRKGNKYLITRARYKSIKAFDHQKMEQFCTDIYKSGYEDGYKKGQDSVPGVDIKAVYEAIAATKGIGPKKLEEIKAQLEPLFDGGQKDGSGEV